MSQTSTRATQTRMHANAQPTTRPLSSPPHQSQPPRSGPPPITNHPSSPAVGKRVPSTADAVRKTVPSKPTRTRWSPVPVPQRQSFTTHENPQRQAHRLHLISHHPLTSLSPGRGSERRPSARTRVLELPSPKRKKMTGAHFVGPFARRAHDPTAWIAFCMRPAARCACAVVGTVECAEIGAAAAGLGLVGGCLWLVAAGETSPASGVERRRGAGRALFGWVMGAGKGGET